MLIHVFHLGSLFHVRVIHVIHVWKLSSNQNWKNDSWHHMWPWTLSLFWIIDMHVSTRTKCTLYINVNVHTIFTISCKSIFLHQSIYIYIHTWIYVLIQIRWYDDKLERAFSQLHVMCQRQEGLRRLLCCCLDVPYEVAKLRAFFPNDMRRVGAPACSTCPSWK